MKMRYLQDCLILYNLRKILSQVSDLDWTVVRPAGLTNNSVTDKEFTVKEDYHVRPDYYELRH